MFNKMAARQNPPTAQMTVNGKFDKVATDYVELFKQVQIPPLCNSAGERILRLLTDDQKQNCDLDENFKQLKYDIYSVSNSPERKVNDVEVTIKRKIILKIVTSGKFSYKLKFLGTAVDFAP